MAEQTAPSNPIPVVEKVTKQKTQQQLKREQDAGTLSKYFKEAMRKKDLGRCLELLEEIQEADFNLKIEWDEQNQAVHHEKLRTIRPQVDSTTPLTFPQSPKKAKKEQLLEDRYTEIERENRLLLEKMSSIMQAHSSRTRSVKKRSLNQEARKRELVKISVENQALLRRLQERQPNYNTQKWEIERRRTERLLQNICHYPYKLGVTDEFLHRRLGSVDSSSMTMSQTAMSGKRPRTRKLNPISQDEGEVVFKRGVNVGEKYFLVEVTERPGMITVTAHDIEKPDSYALDMDTAAAMQLMAGERRFERLVELLAFDHGELRLLDATPPREPLVRPPKGGLGRHVRRTQHLSAAKARPKQGRKASQDSADAGVEEDEVIDSGVDRRRRRSPEGQLERSSENGELQPLGRPEAVISESQGPESLFDFQKGEEAQQSHAVKPPAYVSSRESKGKYETDQQPEVGKAPDFRKETEGKDGSSDLRQGSSPGVWIENQQSADEETETAKDREKRQRTPSAVEDSKSSIEMRDISDENQPATPLEESFIDKKDLTGTQEVKPTIENERKTDSAEPVATHNEPIALSDEPNGEEAEALDAESESIPVQPSDIEREPGTDSVQPVAAESEPMSGPIEPMAVENAPITDLSQPPTVEIQPTSDPMPLPAIENHPITDSVPPAVAESEPNLPQEDKPESFLPEEHELTVDLPLHETPSIDPESVPMAEPAPRQEDREELDPPIEEQPVADLDPSTQGKLVGEPVLPQDLKPERESVPDQETTVREEAKAEAPHTPVVETNPATDPEPPISLETRPVDLEPALTSESKPSPAPVLSQEESHPADQIPPESLKIDPEPIPSLEKVAENSEGSQAIREVPAELVSQITAPEPVSSSSEQPPIPVGPIDDQIQAKPGTEEQGAGGDSPHGEPLPAFNPATAPPPVALPNSEEIPTHNEQDAAPPQPEISQ